MSVRESIRHRSGLQDAGCMSPVYQSRHPRATGADEAGIVRARLVTERRQQHAARDVSRLTVELVSAASVQRRGRDTPVSPGRPSHSLLRWTNQYCCGGIDIVCPGERRQLCAGETAELQRRSSG